MYLLLQIFVSFTLVLLSFTFCMVQTIVANKENGTKEFEPDCQNERKIYSCPAESLGEFNFRHIVNLALLVYCAIYALQSGRHLPDSFNETKLIIISCGCTAIVWTALVIRFYFLHLPAVS